MPGIGAVPATDWLAGSGLPLDNGVACGQNLFTGVPGVYAAGDVARWHNPMFDRLMRLEHWTSAVEQGAVAVRSTPATPSPTPPCRTSGRTGTARESSSSESRPRARSVGSTETWAGTASSLSIEKATAWPEL
ncbi:FAD-dependent oxidoreductase [Microtetraspora niveoalba]|uniref:FAD-dependent oxidoreductase n=1 Tax=Microtetraspora niveoalba TaxID=46175 RepID=UPI001FE0121F|nr:FAD-dependent oxidoreductase [Microtetraspora niveoalba]